MTTQKADLSRCDYILERVNNSITALTFLLGNVSSAESTDKEFNGLGIILELLQGEIHEVITEVEKAINEDHLNKVIT